MADNYLITGYWGEPHVTAENDRGINAAMFGVGRFVLPVGEQFRAEYIGNNTIRMYDGKLMDNGAAAGIPVGEYVDLQIANAGQGLKRNDLIVFQYSQDASTLVERGIFTVIQGAETSGTASDPALTQGDLLSGEATFDQMALWRVSVSGTTISAPVKVFSAFTVKNIGAVAENIPITTDCNTDLKTGGDKILVSKYNTDTLNSPYKEGVVSDSSGMVVTYTYTANYGRQLCFCAGLGGFIGRYMRNGTIEKWVKLADTNYAVNKAGDTSTGNQNIEKANPFYGLKDTATGSEVRLLNSGNVASIHNLNVAGDTSNRRYINLYNSNSTSPSIADALKLIDVAAGKTTVYDILHSGNISNLGVAKIETGTYTGTGEYGFQHPNELTFGFTPNAVVIGVYADPLPSTCIGSFVWLYGAKIGFVSTWLEEEGSFDRPADLEWEGNTLRWDGEDAFAQLNVSGVQYTYIAIGLRRVGI